MLRRESLHKEEAFNRTESFWTTKDGCELYEQAWIPEVSPRAVITLVHGLGEHSSRYQAWASRLAGEGYVVRSFDHRGHGKSSGKKGHIPEYNKVIEDIGSFLKLGNEKYPEIPSFLYGHSLGGNFVLNYVIQTTEKFDGVIITSPWLELKETPAPLLLKTVSLLSKFMPGFQVGNRIRSEDISRDLRVAHAYRTDPMVYHKISLRMFTQCYQAGLKASMSIYKINSPMLIMHGSEDNITSCKASEKFVQNASSKTKFVKWEGCYHELHHDLDKDKVFETLREWLGHYANPETKKNA